MFLLLRNLSLAGLVAICPVFSISYAQPDYGEADHGDEAAHVDHGAEDEHEEGVIEMNVTQRAESGIVTGAVEYQRLANEIMAPGEVVVNAYLSSQVAPRISAQITARHARLGDAVKQGQPLVTLSSVEMAEAQGSVLVTYQEWERVKRLGREVVSEARYIEAQIAHQQAQAKASAYGMTDEQIQALIEGNDATKANGLFDLLAPQSGTVVSDDFVVGEIIAPGRILFELSDESTVWVEARIDPIAASSISADTKVRVSRDGLNWLNGEVIQLHHHLNESTRTQGVRIRVDNQN